VVSRYRTSGWLISLAAHSIIAAGAVLLMAELRLANQQEPFRWQVSVTQPSPQQSAKVPPQPEPSPAPTQAVKQPPNPVHKQSTPTEQRPVQTRHVAQPVQQVAPITRQEVRKVEPVMQTERSLSESIQAPSAVTREAESVNTTGETHFAATSKAATPVTESAVSQSEQIVTQPSSVVTREVMEAADSAATEQAVTEKTVATVTAQTSEAAPAAVETKSVQTKSLAESSLRQPAIEHTAVETSTAETRSIVESSGGPAAVEHAPVETSVVQTAPITEPAVTQQSATQPIQQASIQNAPMQSIPTAKADYGWLLETLWSRVEQLKRYPHIARANRWEGLVVLRAVIDQEGQLVDLKVAESSGHSVLDQDAMDVMRKSCPLKLKHPLGKPKVELRVPISYKLRS
jgi:protein TonB